MIYLLLGAGLWFTFRTGCVQFRYFRQSGQSLKSSFTPHPNGITAFQALCTSLASRIGNGNLAGVALAITAGGPGAIFWMWVVALIGMASSFAECTLAQVYKTKDAAGQFRGGPAWYMERGLGMRWMGVIFALFLILAFGLIFNSVQANSIAFAMEHAFTVPRGVTGVLLAIVAGLIFLLDLRGIARIVQWLVPIIAISWVAIGFGLTLWHIDQVPGMLKLIFQSAFGWHEAAAGAMGYTLSQALASGFQRGIYSNEAGMGSTPNAAAAASWPPHPAAHGILQMSGVFIDTIVICSATAAIILLSDVSGPATNTYDGIVLTQQALSTLIGPWGGKIIAIMTLFFAFTSIIANYAYAENNLIFLHQSSPLKKQLLRILMMGMILLGSLMSLSTVWQMADVIMAFMVITNLVAILLLSPLVSDLAKDYVRQRKLGQLPVFDPQRFPELRNSLAPGVWDNQQPRP